jgi:hypothetical protein
LDPKSCGWLRSRRSAFSLLDTLHARSADILEGHRQSTRIIGALAKFSEKVFSLLRQQFDHVERRRDVWCTEGQRLLV